MRILWLKTELLHPVDKGGKIRTYNMLRELREEHEIIYLCLDDGSASPDAVERSSEYADELVRVPHELAHRGSFQYYAEAALNVPSELPYFVERYRSDVMRDEIKRTLEQRSPDIVVCDFLVPAVNLPDTDEVPTVLFQHNVEAEIWRRHTNVEDNPLKKWYFRQQWQKAERFEGKECKRFDRVVAVSENDREIFEVRYELEDVKVVETGVDTEYYKPTGRRPQKSNHLVFTGSMDWRPNEDAMVWFVEEILPRIRQEVPDATLSIVGRRPTSTVEELETSYKGVSVTGRVPDVRPYLEEASVFVCPLRIGGGTRLKVYEAMAMELPVVSTKVGIEGLPLSDGEELLVTDDAEVFAEKVGQLLKDSSKARNLAQHAASRVRNDFGWHRSARSFINHCRATVT